MRIVAVGVLLALFLGVAPLMASYAPALVALLSVAVAVVLASYVAEEASAFALVCGAGAALGYALPAGGFPAAALFVGAVYAPRALRAPAAWAAGLEVALACVGGGVAAVLMRGYAWAAWQQQTGAALAFFAVAVGVGSLLCMVPFAVVADDRVADLFKRQALAERGAFRVTLLRALVLRRRFVAAGGAVDAASRGIDAQFEGLGDDLRRGLRTPAHQSQAWREAFRRRVREVESAMQPAPPPPHASVDATTEVTATPEVSAPSEVEIDVVVSEPATAVALSSDPA